MKIFIPTNDASIKLTSMGFVFRPLVIEAYKYHLNSRKNQQLPIQVKSVRKKQAKVTTVDVF